MNILITGGLGNLGSWLTQHCLDAGHQVTVLARRLAYTIDHPNYRFVQGDITQLESLQQSLVTDTAEAFDLCLHTASYNEHFHPNYRQQALQINALGTANIAECLLQIGVKHFVYLSTYHVYGKATQDRVLTEATAPLPANDYALTHLFAEHYVQMLAREKNLGFSIIRLSNSYGAPLNPDSNKWYLAVNDLARQALQEGQIQLKGNGLVSRDFIWMGDVCRILLALGQQAPSNRCFNLSSGQNITLLTLAQRIAAAWQTYSGQAIPVLVNEQDQQQHYQDQVLNRQLQQQVPFALTDALESEVIKIWQMLQQEGTHE